MTSPRLSSPTTWSNKLAGHLAAAAAGLLMPACAAFAHSGHGLAGQVHWHATDVLPWVGLVAIGALVYLSRRK